jgi:proline dehydrogenase
VFSPARVTLFTVSSLFLATTTVFADKGEETIRVKDPSLGSFVRAYTVYAMCSVPALADASPRLLSFLTSIHGIKQIVLFCQFVGGDSLTDALPLLRSLRSANKGILLAYSVEVDENEATGGSTFPRDGTHNSPTNVD